MTSRSGGQAPARRLLARLIAAGGVLLSRDVAVLTNAIAFNFLLCLFPLILAVAALAERFPEAHGGRAAAAMLQLFTELIPFGRADLAESLRGLSRVARSLEALSVILIVWGSSGIFIPVEMVLNRVWGGRRQRHFWRSRGLAFVMTLLCGLLVLLSVAVTVAVRAHSREWPTLTRHAAKGSAFLLSFLLFFLIYRVVPDAPIRSRAAVRAALWGACVWEGVKQLFVFKLGQMRLETVYGPLAFAVSLVLWAYVSSLVLVFGALMAPVQAPARRRRS